MPLQVGRIKLATGPDIALRISGHQTGAAQTIEAFGGHCWLSLKHVANDVTEPRVLRERNHNAAQMIAERSVIVVGSGFERCELDPVRRHFVKPPTNQVRMSAYQAVVARHLRLVAEWRAVAAV